jgi:gluconate 2-dehydrogenase gamma chain
MVRDRSSGISRRVFIQRLTFFGGGVVLIGGACRRDGNPQNARPAASPPAKVQASSMAEPAAALKTFNTEEFEVISAACDRLLPRDQDPGALDANVPVYIDRMLLTPEMQHVKQDFLAGTAQLDRRTRQMFGKGFREISESQRDQVLVAFKNSPAKSIEAKYFELLMVLSLEGFLGDPSYGGNKDRVGWALVGFGTSEPPPQYDGVRHLHSHGAR